MAEEKTKFGKFLQKVAGALPDIAEVGLAAISNPIEAVRLVKDKLMDAANADDEKALKAQELLLELKREENNFLRDMYALDTERITSSHELEAVQLTQEDLFTKRARPTRQYFWLLFMLLCYPICFFITGETMDIPETVVVGIFADFGFYTYKRSEEKIKINQQQKTL